MNQIETNQPLLEVKNLSVTFSYYRGTEKAKLYAVRDVSFSIAPGEILGIVGESGSGKTVTTSSICGLLPTNANATGSILYQGKDLLALYNLSNSLGKKNSKVAKEELRSYRGRKIGMIFQEPGRAFDPLQNIFSVFFETFRNSDKNITKKEAFEKAVNLLKETGLDSPEERLKNFPHQFSGGQLQRIGIALALAQDCQLLIADEPTTALDVTIQSQIVRLLLELRKKRGISIIFISHNIDLVAEISDRIMVMYGGMIMEWGGWKQIKNSPIHPYTKALLSVSPAFGSHYSITPLVPIPGKVTDPSNPEPGCPFFPRCALAKELGEGKCQETMPLLINYSGKEERFIRCHFLKHEEVEQC